MQIWHPPVFTHSRDRLLEAEVAHEFLAALLAPRVRRLLSSEHFSVDGTLIDAWASMSEGRLRQATRTGPQRRAQLPQREALQRDACLDHPSDARLYRRAYGRESRLSFMGHVLMENRNGLAVNAALTRATGLAEREAALAMLDRRNRRGRISLAADKAYDVTAFVGDLRRRRVTPQP